MFLEDQSQTSGLVFESDTAVVVKRAESNVTDLCVVILEVNTQMPLEEVDHEFKFAWQYLQHDLVRRSIISVESVQDMDDVASWFLLIHLVADCDNQSGVHGESSDRMDANNLGLYEIIDEQVDIVTSRDRRLDGRSGRHCYSTDSRDKILDRHNLSKVDALDHSIAFVVDQDLD